MLNEIDAYNFLLLQLYYYYMHRSIYKIFRTGWQLILAQVIMCTFTL